MNRIAMGRLLIGAGVALVVLGALVWSGALAWFGRLPGDIRIERDTVRVYVPLASMLLLSIALSLLLQIARRWL